MGGAMNDYQTLLETTERHLQSLKKIGVSYLKVTPEIMEALSQPPPPITKGISLPEIPPLSTPPSAIALASADPSPLVTSPDPMSSLRARALACVKCPNFCLLYTSDAAD